MLRLIGIALFILGIYFFGQDIIFTSSYSGYGWYQFWHGIPAAGSVLAIMSGTICLIFFSRATGNLGWILLGLGAVLVFLSGGVMLKPTSMWDFILAFAALATGFKLMTRGRLGF